jgi:prepilin-type N-terminal cleavage/methylation domain-containing protein
MDIRARRKDRGFTVLELMVTVAILGILAAVAIPSFRNYQWKAKRSEAFVNLGGLANAQKAYFAISDTFLGVAPAEPGTTLGDVPGTVSRASAGIDAAFGPIGWASEGQVYFDYDTNSPNLGLGCACIQCFTSTAYGDIDGDNSQSAVMYVHPGSAGGTCTSSMFGYTTPLDAANQPIYDQVALNRGNDDY